MNTDGNRGQDRRKIPGLHSAYEYVWRSPWVRAVSWTILIAAVITVLILLFPRYSFVLTVAVVGFMVAYLLHPLVEKLHSWRVPRVLAVILVYLGLLGVLVLGSILIAQIFGQLGTFVQEIPDAVDEASETVSRITGWFTNMLA
ncbi:MAG TPA: AI-2E family transporter, partial [Deinococcales bacterium]|nr:AI-2E family transporter [Deinococcales bacterium]